MNDYILFKDINDKYQTLPELLAPAENSKVIYYVTDLNQQGQYISLFKEQGMNAVILNHNIDTSFISHLEMRNENYRFMRIDADLTDSLKEASDEDLSEVTTTLSTLFQSALNNDKLTIKVEKLKNDEIASLITLSEEGRRMQDMMKMYAMHGMGDMDMSMFATDATLTLNANNPLVQYIVNNKESEHVPMFA
jgi:molecular chaperone HtpG